MEAVRETLEIFRNYCHKTMVMVASIRHPLHVMEAARIGAHVAMVPPNVLESMIEHPLTENGIRRFREDWQRVQKLRT
jgi:transaldolase